MSDIAVAAVDAQIAATETAEAESQATQAAAAAATATLAAEQALATAATSAALTNAAAAETIAEVTAQVDEIEAMERARDQQWATMQSQLQEFGGAIATLTTGLALVTDQLAALNTSTLANSAPASSAETSEIVVESADPTQESRADHGEPRRPRRAIRKI